MALSDNIEQFIKEMMSESEHELELRRNELASYFGCAPSQINYVLATRFSPDHGYLIESRRGGAGYVRIIRISPGCDRSHLIRQMLAQLTERTTLPRAQAMIGALAERKLITKTEASLMLAAVSDTALSLPVGAKDLLRTCILRSMLTSLLSKQEE